MQEHRHSQTSLYIYEEDGYVPLARVDGTGEHQSVRYYHNDLNGLPEQLTEADGKTVWQARYQVWGNADEEVREAYFIEEQNLRFQGQYLDREIGLHYNTFRFYDPDVGRFTTPDPIGLMGGLNLYQYAPNPIGWIDPWGWSCVQLKRCKRGQAIDKPLPSGKAPAWDVVRNRYWKNRYEASKASGEFSPANMSRMKRGSAPLDANGNSMELHHHNPQRNGGVDVNNPRNLREVTREQHAALDEFRHLGTK